MNIIQIILLGIVVCLVAMVLKEHGNYSKIIVYSCSVAIILFALNRFKKLYEFIVRLQQYSGITSKYGEIVLKIIGLLVLSEFAISVCNDEHHQSLSSAIEFGSKCSIILVALPIFEDVFEIIVKLLK